MNNIKISIYLDKRQILNDVAVQAGVLGRILSRMKETEEQGGDLMWPESELNKPLVARAMTEAYGQVKAIAGAYLVYGKDEDDNRLEALDHVTQYKETIQPQQTGSYDLIVGLRHVLKIKSAGEVTLTTTAGRKIGTFNGSGEVEYIPEMTCRLMTSGETKVTYCTPVYGALELVLAMPGSYNMGMTETVKSCAHRMMVDYILQSLLMHHWPEKASLYAAKFGDDTEGLRVALRARTRFGRRAEDWS